MKTITVTRKKKFAGAVMPYWVITGVRKAAFCSRYNLSGDLCEQSENGFPIPRIDMKVLDEIGTRISNGETISIELKEGETTLFASTADGCLSNEVQLNDYWQVGLKITITTKGGFKTLPHPVIEKPN